MYSCTDLNDEGCLSNVVTAPHGKQGNVPASCFYTRHKVLKEQSHIYCSIQSKEEKNHYFPPCEQSILVQCAFSLAHWKQRKLLA